LKTTPQGILADKNTYQTSEGNIFVTGNAIRSSRLAVRSVGQGKEVAFSVWQYLNNEPVKGEPSLFNSRFGKLLSSEFSEYLKESVSYKRIYPIDGGRNGFTAAEAVDEALRCLHCDCRAVDSCKLRIYSDRYRADQRRFKTSERRKIVKLNTHATLIYEPNKCIRCGICVRLTAKYGEKFGFTYIGRGFDVELGVPFNEDIRNALTETAIMVAEGCPVGAIELKST
jgi:ferredoxin